MNRRDASREATEGKRTFGDLRAMIRVARERGGMSRVNKQIPLAKALDLYEAAIRDRPEDEVVVGLRPDAYRPGRMRRTRDSLIVQNILRDCPEPGSGKGEKDG